MTDTTISAEPPRLRVGAVFSRALDLLFADFGKFFLLGLLAWSPVFVASLIIGFRYAVVGPGAIAGPTLGIGVFVVGILTGASFILSQAVILFGTVEKMRGKSFALGTSLRQGLARFFPIIGLYIVMVLAIMLGFVLLIIPGIILAMMFYVALPVCIVERQGPIASLNRSTELTKGNRWRLFGIGLLLYLANLIGQTVIQFALRALAGGTVSGIGVFVWSVVIGAVNAILVAVIYHDLRVAREGIDIDHIAAVFD
jgi:uncharacterized membrane protein